MSRSNPSEERFPLLLLFLEDGQRASKQNKRILIDKGRYQGIASGASTVITQWPGHIASCWITATLIVVSIIIVSMLMVAFSMHPGINNLTAQCKRHKIFQTNDSATIHLAHGPGVWTKKQLYILEQIVQNYPQSRIEIIMIRNMLDFLPKLNDVNYMYSTVVDYIPSTKPHLVIRKRETEKVQLNVTDTARNNTAVTTIKSVVKQNLTKTRNSVDSKKDIEFDIKIGSKGLVDIRFLKVPRRIVSNKTETLKNKIHKKPKTIQNLLKTYPKMKVVNSTYERIFKNTPLFLTWHNTNEDTRLFAIRVLKLWNNGGIAFSLNDMSEPFDKSVNENSNSTAELERTTDSEIKRMITVGISNYKSLPVGLVTIDDEGFHVETKTPCHAFLGELLIELKKANRNTKPADIIRRTLHRFCLKKAVDANYCKTIDG
ncbi:hypothetical protein RN001_013556 [Aquatica leii]|uniref:Uncharacterized protein n=1 Tax=Aquatica leii TaxID=1421715 RepID=A0AAN7P2M4_9COLE|nr:hypothetical protein RN001_013556 [Aquatica leii]